jgi:hypothetical protein
VAFFFGAVHSRAKWPERPQLKQVWPEVAPAVGGAGGEPTIAAGAGAAATVEVGRWSRGGTPSGTSEEHYRMEQPQSSSS